MKKRFICRLCPLECEIQVSLESEMLYGNHCSKGEHYVREEILYPKRVVTSTVQIEHADVKRLPVMISRAVPKEKIEEVMQIIHKIHVSAPVYAGDCILKNIAHTQADLLASRTLLRKKED